MTSLFFYFIIVILFSLFLYFIDVKNGTRSSFVARILLSEIILFVSQFTIILLFERVFKGAIITFFSPEGFAPMWLSFILTIIFIALFCFFIFGVLVLLLLCSMPLPKITYSSKIAPIMSIVASSLLFFCSFDVYSVVFTALLTLILTPLVFADHDYEVKQSEIETSPDIIEASYEELKQYHLQKQENLRILNESYKRNPFVRINRGLH